MHRDRTLNLLDNYIPYNTLECEYKKKIIHFIKKNSNCFDRSNIIGHITSSAWLINHSRNKVLLMHHKKLNEWLQFGGHADGESDLLSVAIKETREESGIFNVIPIMKNIFDLDIHYTPEYKNISEHIHYDIRFLLQVVDNSEPKKNHESLRLKWFDQNLKKFPNHKPSLIRMFEKWLLLPKG
jgi:8-oxo-dGTP pyrophosphatase MutT (NUDIX family)